MTAFDLHAPHTELEVTASSVVETDKPEDPELSVSWDDLASEAVADRFDEMLSPSHYTPASKRIERVGRRIAKDNDPQQAVIEAARWVQGELTYVAGTTGVHSSGLDALREGKGVCQDFAHLTLILLRGWGFRRATSRGICTRTATPPSAIPSRDRATPGSGLDRGVVVLRPDQRHRHQRAVHQRRCGPGLLGRDAVEGHLLGEGSTDLDVMVEITRLA